MDNLDADEISYGQNELRIRILEWELTHPSARKSGS